LVELNKKHLHEEEQRPETAKKARIIEHDDLDADDFEDPMMVSEYVHEIFEYLRELEVFFADKGPNHA
jgi:G2/mitotic-specific cyclin 1/2